MAPFGRGDQRVVEMVLGAGLSIFRTQVSGSRAGRPGDVCSHGGDDQTSPAIHGESSHREFEGLAAEYGELLSGVRQQRAF